MDVAKETNDAVEVAICQTRTTPTKKKKGKRAY